MTNTVREHGRHFDTRVNGPCITLQRDVFLVVCQILQFLLRHVHRPRQRTVRVSLIVVPGCLFVAMFVCLFVCPRQRMVLLRSSSSAAAAQQQAAA